MQHCPLGEHRIFFRHPAPPGNNDLIIGIVRNGNNGSGNSVGFGYYVNNFGNYNKLYGSIGTLIVIMLWIYFNSLILILGFELNASIDNAKRKKFATKE